MPQARVVICALPGETLSPQDEDMIQAEADIRCNVLSPSHPLHICNAMLGFHLFVSSRVQLAQQIAENVKKPQMLGPHPRLSLLCESTWMTVARTPVSDAGGQRCGD